MLYLSKERQIQIILLIANQSQREYTEHVLQIKAFILSFLPFFSIDAGPLVTHNAERWTTVAAAVNCYFCTLFNTLCWSEWAPCECVCVTSAGCLCFTALPTDAAPENTCNSSCAHCVSHKSTQRHRGWIIHINTSTPINTLSKQALLIQSFQQALH